MARARRGIDPKTGKKEEDVVGTEPREGIPTKFAKVSREERGRVEAIKARAESPEGKSALDLIQERQEKEGIAEEVPIPTEVTPLVAPGGTVQREEQIEKALEAERVREDVFLNPSRVRAENKIARLEAKDDINFAEQALLNRLRGKRDTIEGIQNIIIAVGAGTEGKAFGIVDDILFDRGEVVQNKQSAITTYHGLIDDVGQGFQSGEYISPAEALNELNQIENIITNIESDIQNEAILSPAVRTSGELTDIEADILEARKKLANNRRIVLGLTQQ